MLHKKIKKVMLIAIIILGVTSLIDGIANNFNSQKWLYISIFSKDQIIKNELIIHKKHLMQVEEAQIYIIILEY